MCTGVNCVKIIVPAVDQPPIKTFSFIILILRLRRLFRRIRDWTLFLHRVSRSEETASISFFVCGATFELRETAGHHLVGSNISLSSPRTDILSVYFLFCVGL